MTTTELSPFTLEFEDVLPIVLLPPPEVAKSLAESRSTESPEPDMDLSEQEDDCPNETAAPPHPIPSMQEAFDESLVEATKSSAPDKPKLREHDAKMRRERLIAQEKGDEIESMRWRYRPGQEQHELCKLMAQIAFGMYLLVRGMANSDDQVVSIIQGHIDEIDEFLEVASEDFKQATADLTERIKYLRLPLEHMEVFEKILEDRSYRAELIRNNETIEHILSRTTAMLVQYEKDTNEGLRSTKAFANYLTDDCETEELAKRPEVADIYGAMKGNTNGWHNAFMDLGEQAQKLSGLITELAVMVAEMQAKAGEVSRRTWINIEPFSLPGVRRSEDMSPPTTAMSGRSPSSSNSVRESVSTVKATSQRRLTIRAQLPPPMENPLDDPNEATRFYDGDSDRSSQADAVVPDTNNEPDASSTLYLLQPRTYTPVLPAPLPSPMVKARPAATPAPLPQPMSSPGIPKRSSLRQRVSLKANPPESIQIPPPNVLNSSSRPRMSPKIQCPPDSAYGSDDQRNRSGSGTGEPSPSFAGRVVPSPRSDLQTYHPVQASPYSPLQQRPHTSHNTIHSATTPTSTTPTSMAHTTASGYRPRHVRNQPSRLGGASTLSKVTTLTYASATSQADSAGGGGGGGHKKLKKKRSAFGWLKKAFSLDEEEKAAFDARRVATEERNLYYEERSRRFLDGRTVRGPPGTSMHGSVSTSTLLGGMR